MHYNLYKTGDGNASYPAEILPLPFQPNQKFTHINFGEGKLIFEDNTLKFTGDIEESAKQFVDFCNSILPKQEEQKQVVIDVEVHVAVSDSGDVTSCVYDPYNSQQYAEYRTWYKNIQQHPQLWSIKRIKTKVNYPYQSEEV